MGFAPDRSFASLCLRHCSTCVGKDVGLKLNISETDNSLDYDLALSIAPYLGIKKDNALEIVKQIKSIVAEWRKVAKRYGISNSEQDLVENAFRY